MPPTPGVTEAFGSQVWELPPLILHPFSDSSGPGKLLASSKANLMLTGLLPSDAAEDELEQRLLEGRYCEIRMLYFVGRDLNRWIHQCVEFATGLVELQPAALGEPSFTSLLVHHPPDPVRRKLQTWGVVDFRSIFSRALGLNTLFAEAPEFSQLAPEFIRNYYRYTDYIFACRQQMQPFTEITSANFHFEVYASGEYARMLEKAWQDDPPALS